MRQAPFTSKPIGASVPRDRARRLVTGKGRYADDARAPRALVAAFVRSPHGRADILSIDATDAEAMDGVYAVLAAADIEAIARPWRASHTLFPEMHAPEQSALAKARVNYQGEPVVIVLASSRSLAEDAAELVLVDYEPLIAVATLDAALAEDAPLIHESLGTNVCYVARCGDKEIGDPFDHADFVIEDHLDFGRHTACSLETRSLVAAFDAASGELSVRISHQCPHQLQDALAQILGVADHRMSVVTEDVGGAYGLKQQLYADEVAVCAAAIKTGRPVRFVADRLEAFSSDNHAREHHAAARIAVRADGTILGLEIDDLFPIGAYPQYPRTSLGEGNHVLRMSGAGYSIADYRARVTLAFQNKSLIGHYRSVGHPIACAIAEHMVDLAANQTGLTPEEIRRRNYHPADAYPLPSASGVHLEHLSQHACLDRLIELMNLDGVHRDREEALARGIRRGIGLASFVELTGTGSGFYGPGGINVSAQDGCTVKLEPSGVLRCLPSVTDQGQGTDTGIAQIVAAVMGVDTADVRVISGDSSVTPYGGGAWASRGISTGGEAAYKAAVAVRDSVLEIAAHLLQSEASRLELRDGSVMDGAGTARMTLAELARIGHFRHDLLPIELQPEFTATRHATPRDQLFQATNGIQASYVEVDCETGFIRLLAHWVVHDGGTIINPMLVDEQIRGGVVQGLGAALFEELIYDGEGQLQTASLADYLVPMAGDMPDISVAHVSVPAREGALGAKGVGEAGVAGASGAVLNAVNDALRPLGARVTALPITPLAILKAVGMSG